MLTVSSSSFGFRGALNLMLCGIGIDASHKMNMSMKMNMNMNILLLRNSNSNSNYSQMCSFSYSPICSLRTGTVETRAVVNANPPPPMCAGNGMPMNMPVTSQHQHLLQVVLFSPQIPGNTGCIARTCAASGVKLHLVEPLGFRIDSTKLKRAGLDYWPYVVIKVHRSWAEFRDYFSLLDGERRLLAFTKRGTSIHSDYTYRPGDWLVFGSETSGLTDEVLSDCRSEKYGGGTIKIPMVDTYVRCLNLSVSVGIAVYEAARQLNYDQLHFSPETCSNDENPFILEREDIFA